MHEPPMTEQETEAFARSLLEQKMNEPFSRRQFVRRVGGAVLATSLGASLAAAGAAASTSEIGGTLNMVIWDGYDDKVASAPFRKKYGVKTQATYIGNNEQIFTKLRAGGVGSIDLVTPYHGYIKVLVEAGLLQPVDYSKLPNVRQNLIPPLRHPATKTIQSCCSNSVFSDRQWFVGNHVTVRRDDCFVVWRNVFTFHCHFLTRGHRYRQMIEKTLSVDGRHASSASGSDGLSIN